MSTINSSAAKTGIRLTDTLSFMIALFAGFMIGNGFVPDLVMGYCYMAFGIVCIFYAFRGDLNKFLSLLPYLIYTEIYVRGSAHFVLNLYADYILLASFVLLLVKQGTLITLRSR